MLKLFSLACKMIQCTKLFSVQALSSISYLFATKGCFCSHVTIHFGLLGRFRFYLASKVLGELYPSELANPLVAKFLCSNE